MTLARRPQSRIRSELGVEPVIWVGPRTAGGNFIKSAFPKYPQIGLREGQILFLKKCLLCEVFPKTWVSTSISGRPYKLKQFEMT